MKYGKKIVFYLSCSKKKNLAFRINRAFCGVLSEFWRGMPSGVHNGLCWAGIETAICGCLSVWVCMCVPSNPFVSHCGRRETAFFSSLFCKKQHTTQLVLVSTLIPNQMCFTDKQMYTDNLILLMFNQVVDNWAEIFQPECSSDNICWVLLQIISDFDILYSEDKHIVGLWLKT